MDFLEIPKYKNKPVKEMNRMERWLAYFANRLDPLGKEELAMATPEIGDAIEASNEFVMDEMTYRKYLQRESAIWDYNNDILGSEQAGYDKGFDEGQCQIVEEMMKGGVDFPTIARFSKWPLAKVEAYAAKRKQG